MNPILSQSGQGNDTPLRQYYLDANITVVLWTSSKMAAHFRIWAITIETTAESGYDKPKPIKYRHFESDIDKVIKKHYEKVINIVAENY